MPACPSGVVRNGHRISLMDFINSLNNNLFFLPRNKIITYYSGYLLTIFLFPGAGDAHILARCRCPEAIIMAVTSNIDPSHDVGSTHFCDDAIIESWKNEATLLTSPFFRLLIEHLSDHDACAQCVSQCPIPAPFPHQRLWW